MTDDNNRIHARKRVWEDTQATIKVDDPFSPGSRSRMTVKGTVGDLSTGGMFLKTTEPVPLSSKAEIRICFDPDSASDNLSVTATGETVHARDEGIGIKFLSIDLAELQQCIIKKMNKK